MIRLVCSMHTNIANTEEFNSSVSNGLLFLAHGKGHKSLTSPWFKENFPVYLNTVRALMSVAYDGENVQTASGDQYHVSEYSLGAGFRKLVEYSSVYLTPNGRYVTTPFLVANVKPDEKTGIMSPSQVNAFNSFLQNVDGLNFSTTKVDVMDAHLFSEVNAIEFKGSVYQVAAHSSLEDVIFASVANFSCGADLTSFGRLLYDQISEVQVVQWLFGCNAGSGSGGKENVE